MLVFEDGPPPPEILEVFSTLPIIVIVLLSLFITGVYYLGRRSGQTGANRAEPWSRTEILTAAGVIVMVATLFVTLLNAEVRKWLGLP